MAECLIRAVLRVEAPLSRSDEGWWLASTREDQFNVLKDRKSGDSWLIADRWRLTHVTFGAEGSLTVCLRPDERFAKVLPTLWIQARLDGLEIGLERASVHMTLEKVEPDGEHAPVAAALGQVARLLAVRLFETGWLRRRPPVVLQTGRSFVVELAPGLLSPLYERSVVEFIPRRLEGALPKPWLSLADRRGIEVLEFGRVTLEDSRLVLPVRLRHQPEDLEERPEAALDAPES
jgi:hypothetical protein